MLSRQAKIAVIMQMACLMAASTIMQHLSSSSTNSIPGGDALDFDWARRMLARCQEALGRIQQDCLVPRSAAAEKAAVYALILVSHFSQPWHLDRQAVLGHKTISSAMLSRKQSPVLPCTTLAREIQTSAPLTGFSGNHGVALCMEHTSLHLFHRDPLEQSFIRRQSPGTVHDSKHARFL